ncbi:MAG TPA: hypothetical protein VNH11_25065 [Pirellulales bacterium]|nr:hypothetical protein [Pirellulales bacterium]
MTIWQQGETEEMAMTRVTVDAQLRSKLLDFSRPQHHEDQR